MPAIEHPLRACLVRLKVRGFCTLSRRQETHL